MHKQSVIVIGASAGGVEALIHLCGLLPANLPAAVFIVLHTAPTAPGLLPRILNRHSKLAAGFPKQGEPIRSGKIYIAPPDLHLLVHHGTIELSSGPRENLVRPAVDTLFRSAAHAFGPKVIGIVLSGTRNDGTAGLVEIHKQGGVTIVQDPNEALFPGMPESVLQHLKVDYILSLDEIGEKIVRLTNELVADEQVKNDMANGIDKENTFIQQDKHRFEETMEETQKTMLTCPECGGVLWEMHEGSLPRYACHVGHSFSEGSLLIGKTKALEDALWLAVRSLEEHASLSMKMANRMKSSGSKSMCEQYHDQAQEAKKAADLVRSIIHDGVLSSPEKEPGGFDT